MKRDELSTIGASLLTSLQSLIHSAFAQAGLTAADVHGIELLGGGVRMQIVQAAIAQMFPPSIVMGAKLDDCSVALGASLRCCQGLAEPSSSIKETGRGTVIISSYWLKIVLYKRLLGLSSETISTYRQQELDMQKTDAEVRALLAARNSLEAYVLDMRGVPRRKHGQNVDVTALNAVLDACEVQY